MSELKEIVPKLKTGEEYFCFQEKKQSFQLLDFWRWNQSNILDNTTRGILAEFIVKMALNIQSETRIEWDSFDLKTNDEVKIEVKSSAYIQSWGQKDYSKISFSINPAMDANNLNGIKKRWADYYVFCVLTHKDQNTINPLNLDQWTFYVLQTSIIDEKCPTQKSISLASLIKLKPAICNYEDLKIYFINKTGTDV
jgi:NADPH-dependent 7-cyano-7-deazaguanine reductase QueF-like protein